MENLSYLNCGQCLEKSEGSGTEMRLSVETTAQISTLRLLYSKGSKQSTSSQIQ